MAWTMAAVPEDPGLNPSSYLVVHNYLQLQFQENLIRYSLLASMGIVCTKYTDRHASEKPIRVK